MLSWMILALPIIGVSLWLYCCYKDYMWDKREKKMIKQALKDAGYV